MNLHIQQAQKTQESHTETCYNQTGKVKHKENPESSEKRNSPY